MIKMEMEPSLPGERLTQTRRRHISRLLEESPKLSPKQVLELAALYEIGRSIIYCDVAILTRPEILWHFQARRKVAAQNDRAKNLGLEGRVTADEWLDLCEKYGEICLCCKKDEPLTLDHVTPLSKGGANTIDNVQPLCLQCNIKKHTDETDYR